MGPALANPTAPKVVNGKAVFSTKGSTLTITNSNGAIINWGSFSIGAGEVTRFIQSSSSSQVLNRVTGQDPSVILGQLQSNGHVYLINPNGVAFGPGAQVDVAGLVVSTLDISNADFTAGALNFTSSGNRGAISNAGSLSANAPSGKIYLVAPEIENSGVIKAPNGDIMLVAGASVTIFDTQNPSLSVEVAAPAGQAVNLGQIIAHSTSIYGATVAQDGLIEATHVVNGPGGTILLAGSSGVSLGKGSTTDVSNDSGAAGSISINGGSGTAAVAGQINAIGASGGQVIVTASNVNLSGASVDASGATAGGTILVGGGSKGANAAITNAKTTSIDSSSSLIANATGSGNGGKIVVFSNNDTEIEGSISAKGGANAGDGGSVETSGHVLGVTGSIDVSAARGKGGTWLLDPYDVTIEAGTDSGTSGPPNYNATANSAIVSTTTLDAALNGGATVTVSTGNGGAQSGNITVAGAIAVTGSSASSLTLSAYNNININSPITASGGALTLNLSPNIGLGTGVTTVSSVIDTNNGAINFDGPALVSGGTLRNSIVSGTGALNMSGSNNFTAITLNENAVQGSGTLFISSGLTLDNAHALTIGSAGSSATLTYNGSQTIAGTGSLIFTGSSTDFIQQAAGGQLTLGSAITLNNQASTLDFYNTQITNQGTIIENTSGATLNVGYFGSDVFTNLGVIDVGAGTVNLVSNWHNGGGVINLSGGALNLSGTFATADIGTINRAAAGSAILSGVLNNSGASLDLSATGPNGLIQISGGTIEGGTLQNLNASTSAVQVAVGATAFLDGVTLDQNMLVPQGTLEISGGLTMVGGHVITLGSGGNSILTYNGSQTIAGTGSLIFTGSSTDFIQQAAGGQLTLGSAITLNNQASTLDFYNTQITNQGTIIENTSGATLNVGYFGSDVFTNLGVIDVGAGTVNLVSNWHNGGGVINLSGGALNLSGTLATADIGTINRAAAGSAILSGVLNNSGASLDLSATGPNGLIQISGGTIEGGTLQNLNASTSAVQVAVGATAFLDGVTLDQNMLVPQGTLEISGGLTMVGGHVITLGSGGNSILTYNGSQTIAGTGSLIFTGSSTDFIQQAAGGQLTLGSAITLNNQANYSRLLQHPDYESGHHHREHLGCHIERRLFWQRRVYQPWRHRCRCWHGQPSQQLAQRRRRHQSVGRRPQS